MSKSEKWVQVGATKRPVLCGLRKQAYGLEPLHAPSSVCNWTENLLGVELSSESLAALIMMLFWTTYWIYLNPEVG